MFTVKELEARIAELDSEIKRTKEARLSLVDSAISDKRDLSDDESAKVTALQADSAQLASQRAAVDSRLVELRETKAAAKRAAAEFASGGDNKFHSVEDSSAPTGGARTQEKVIYRKNGSESYFRDLYSATQQGDSVAADRLRRSMAIEKDLRAAGDESVGSVTWSGGAPGIPSGPGGVFAPPSWLVAQFAALARPGRVTVDLFDGAPLPGGVSSINIPVMTGGTSVGYQATELTALSGTTITTSEVNSGIVTVGGKQVVSLQMLQQSAIPFDSLILGDLARAYAQNLNGESLNGTGASGHLRGLKAAAGLVTLPIVPSGGGTTTPTAVDVYRSIAQAAAKIHAVRYESPDTVLMHPGAWAMLLTANDSTNRPLVAPVAPMNNPASVANGGFNSAAGHVGSILGMDVFIDPMIVTSANAGPPAYTQAETYVFLRNDIKVWENGPEVQAFDAPYAEEAGVLFRILGYAAQIPDRYGSSIVKVTGASILA